MAHNREKLLLYCFWKLWIMGRGSMTPQQIWNGARCLRLHVDIGSLEVGSDASSKRAIHGWRAPFLCIFLTTDGAN